MRMSLGSPSFLYHHQLLLPTFTALLMPGTQHDEQDTAYGGQLGEFTEGTRLTQHGWEWGLTCPCQHVCSLYMPSHKTTCPNHHTTCLSSHVPAHHPTTTSKLSLSHPSPSPNQQTSPQILKMFGMTLIYGLLGGGGKGQKGEMCR